MISKQITFIDLGQTGGGISRRILHHRIGNKKLEILDDRCHLPLSYAHAHFPSSAGPSFSVMRNPFDWYLAYWNIELKAHRWRGAFRDWLYNRVSFPYQSLRKECVRGMQMWDWWLYFTETEEGGGPAVDYVVRFENYLDDLVFVLPKIISGITGAQIRQWWPYACEQPGQRTWIEGVEQWMRDELYTPEMVKHVYEQDAPIFEEYGYTFEERYFHHGGYAGVNSARSCHPGIGDIGWERERVLSEHWRTFDSLG